MKTTALKIGDPLDEKTDIGTIINEDLKRSDARLVFGGLPPRSGLSEGYYALPTVFADRSNDWRLAREEIFGPVLVAIRMANDSYYELAAYVWTHDIGAGLRMAHAIERLLRHGGG
jgi:acyl-CoA reductase-like NAD-dependent aldehyde dehydrogenase